ncbi:chemotaxis protein CheA [Allosediminivita pacifica]|uniref:Chemotaxis protein CheA n=1 Tax=Allosediminivita pacifica TaxID=1267769 RepID=A0A2T6AW53_9RHOB|nr:chemotaxis protein CheA [Allosediminivita pacifica]PTX48052.1 two-component system chemotaxis sensor kinase CheA [Allosediminivita pacifica]GGB11858.1 chemotaxis protein CheA [Allosediminivita pacifica]
MMDEETLATFLAEAEGLVESLEAQLLALRDRPTDRALIDGVFRDLHTLKGSGAMFGREDIAGFLHQFESAFEGVRDGTVAVDDELIAISLAARDHVAHLLGNPGDGGGQPLLERLTLHLGQSGAPQAVETAGGHWQLRFFLPPDTLSLGGRPEIVLEELRALGAADPRPILGELPVLEDLDPLELCLGWEMELPGKVTEDEIHAVFMFHEEGLRLELMPPGGDRRKGDRRQGSTTRRRAPATATVEKTAAPPATSAQAPALMRVPAERLDDMMDRVGELVIAEARLIEIANRSGDANLMLVAEDIRRLATAMRDTTMSIRMTPIGTIAGRFRRLVHDLSAKLGRAIEFSVEGEETELDKTVVERLTEPLMHIIRNSADHGLEAAEERLEQGKREAGKLVLSARYSGAEVLISVTDGGRGMNRDAIRARAIERGLIAEGTDLAGDALLNLIFEPGFSTASQVTELSGRGVGMDVVRRTVEGLRGSIQVASEPGHGSSVTLRLPLTLAIIDGLLIETAGERYVIPLAAVDEIVELPAAQARPGGGNAFLDIRDSLVPYLRLRGLLNCQGSPGPFQKVVVVTSSEGRVGLVVDRIIGSNQTVIKQLSPLHAELKTFSGATILGDGAVALILDVPHLIQRGRCEADAGREAA